jgi:hypothetical protein
MLPRRRSLPALLVAAALCASPAAAQWRLFAPRPVDNDLDVDLVALAETDELLAGGRRSGWSDLFLTQKLRLASEGYAYHPRFLQYHLGLGGGFKQERYESFSRGGGERRMQGRGFEYDLRLHFLPEHPYNVQLFALRYEPLFKERAATRRNSVETRYGADLRYRRKPYLLRTRYTDDEVEAGGASSRVQRLAWTGEYFRELPGDRLLSVSGAFDPSRFRTSGGIDGDAREARLGSFLDLGRWRLRSQLARDVRHQRGGGTGRFDSDELLWEEQLTVKLPLGFRAELAYHHRDDDTKTGGGAAGPELDLSSRRRELQLDLHHRLYQSLDSRYGFRRTQSDGTFGDSAARSHALGMSYSKAIPRGRVTTSVDLSRTDTDSSGRIGVADEAHDGVAVPGTFALRNAEADLATLVVLLRSPLPPFELVRLSADVHYRVAVVGNVVEVTVFALPAEVALPGSYDFRVSYLAGGEFRLRSDAAGYSASVRLLDGLFTPYYRHRELRSDVRAGSFPRQALDATTDVVGLELMRGPLRLRVERQDVEWEVGPYEAWLAELRYAGALGSRGTTLSASASYLGRDYARGRADTLGEPVHEELESAAATLQQRLAGRRLTLSLGGSYSRIRGVVDNEAYSVSSSLGFHVGRLDVAAGGAVARSETPGAAGGGSTRRTETYHLRVRRTVF